VPVIIKRLLPGDYEMIQESFKGVKEKALVKINSGIWTGKVFLPVNAMVRLTLKPVEPVNE